MSSTVRQGLNQSMSVAASAQKATGSLSDRWYMFSKLALNFSMSHWVFVKTLIGVVADSPIILQNNTNMNKVKMNGKNAFALFPAVSFIIMAIKVYSRFILLFIIFQTKEI